MNGELAAADVALVANDHLLAALLSGSDDCVKILDLDGKLQFMSDGGKRVMEVDDFSAIKSCPWPDFWLDDGNQAAKNAIEAARRGETAQFFGAANTAKGNPKYWDVKVMPIRGADGSPTHLLSISRDITETRIAKETASKLFDDAKDAAIREAEAMRRLLQNAPSFMCVLEGPDNVFKITNNAYLQLVGHRDLIGLTVREAFPELEGQVFFDLLDEVYSTGKPFVGRGIEIGLQKVKDGPLEQAYLNFVYQPVFDADGAVSGIFVEGSDVSDQKRAELDLQNKEMQLTLALDAAGMGVWQSTVSGDSFIDIHEDDRASELLGRRKDQPAAYDSFLSRVHSDDRAGLGQSAKKALGPDGGGILDVEYRIVADVGRPERWIHARAQAIVEGGITRFIGTVRDISARKESETQQQLLSGELQHRIKNTLAMVSAIASQTLRGDGITAQREAFNARLHTLGHAHDLLLGETQDQGAIGDVVRTALAPHINSADQFEIRGPAIRLSAKQTLSLALAVHELATNATKYGALSTSKGRVIVSWTDNPAFSFTWEEVGGPHVVVPTRTGFGSRLISRVLASDFKGSVKVDYLPTGVICTLMTPTPIRETSTGDAT